LDVHMSWLRGVVEPNPRKPIYLRTKRGVGYTFCPDGEAAPGAKRAHIDRNGLADSSESG
ncbi:MAG: winged helix-turn-helix domain-containing protein, partial [Anaerolineae bacterium]